MSRCRPLLPEESDKGGKMVIKVMGGDKMVIEAAGKVKQKKMLFVLHLSLHLFIAFICLHFIFTGTKLFGRQNELKFI